MTPAAFSYARPGSLDAAVDLLADLGSDALVLAGGQSLIPLLVQRAVRPRLVIDINRIPDLDRIEVTDDHIRMGALVRQEAARRCGTVRDEVPGLAEALDWVASPVIRTRGTVVGNLVANAPGTELPAVAIALGARFVLIDGMGVREMAAADLLSPGCQLPQGSLVSHVRWPRSPGCGGFYEVARRDGHAPVVGAMVALGAHDCRVGLCGVTAVGMACPTVARGVFARFPLVPAAADIDAWLAQDLGQPPFEAQPPFETAFVGADYRRRVAPTVIERAVEATVRARMRPGSGVRPG